MEITATNSLMVFNLAFVGFVWVHKTRLQKFLLAYRANLDKFCTTVLTSPVDQSTNLLVYRLTSKFTSKKPITSYIRECPLWREISTHGIYFTKYPMLYKFQFTLNKTIFKKLATQNLEKTVLQVSWMPSVVRPFIGKLQTVRVLL